MSVCRNVAVAAFPALQCVVFDLFIVRPANKSSLGKDLETQQEVVISMLLRLLQHHQVVSMVLGDRHMSSVSLHCGVMWYRKAKDLGDAGLLPREMCTRLMLSIRWCLRKLSGIKWYHHVQNDEVRWTTGQPHLPVRPHCTNARRNRCWDLNSFPFGELDETTRMPSYYVDEDYPTRPVTSPWMNQWRRSELFTLETDVYIWHYALLVLHAINEWWMCG